MGAAEVRRVRPPRRISTARTLESIAEELRAEALDYPETYEESPWGDRVVKVARCARGAPGDAEAVEILVSALGKKR